MISAKNALYIDFNSIHIQCSETTEKKWIFSCRGRAKLAISFAVSTRSRADSGSSTRCTVTCLRFRALACASLMYHVKSYNVTWGSPEIGNGLDPYTYTIIALKSSGWWGFLYMLCDMLWKLKQDIWSETRDEVSLT